MEKVYQKMPLLFNGSNTSSRAQNLISVVQIVATQVSNLFSKFKLDHTINEVGSTCWWNLGKCVFSLSSILSCFFLFFSVFFFNVIDLVPKYMGPNPSHTREPNTLKSTHSKHSQADWNTTWLWCWSIKFNFKMTAIYKRCSSCCRWNWKHFVHHRPWESKVDYSISNNKCAYRMLCSFKLTVSASAPTTGWRNFIHFR